MTKVLCVLLLLCACGLRGNIDPEGIYRCVNSHTGEGFLFDTDDVRVFVGIGSDSWIEGVDTTGRAFKFSNSNAANGWRCALEKTR